MSVLGYVFVVITTVFYLGLGMLTASKPNLAGENAMGYGLGFFFLGVGFAISSLVLTIAINSKGGFQWVTTETGLRTPLVFATWFVVALTTFFCATFKWEWPSDTLYPQFLHWLGVHHGQLWVPLLWLLPCFLSLGATGQPTGLYRLPFFTSMLIGAVFTAGLLTGYFRESAQRAEAEIATRTADEARWHQDDLNTIAAQQVQDPIYTLLSYTNRFQADDVRAAALAKIKARPAWESDLLAVLTNKDYYKQAYYFLDGNAVTHPEQFARPLNQSLLWLAETVRNDINGSNNLQHWSFDSYGIERALRAIDEQFMNRGVDFYPAVQTLRAALNTTPPDRFKDVRFDITPVVDQWLANHRKR
ncbi:hypothetical protein FAES_1652 [Fibrella aestuarina BUZ 2]|uniref:Uncharacterized protein n=1 Tax=Fibrella aestuarina BUZ 2 TaxID=1166018 RepID=I0K6A9_9BACT|nr:hypothetical protein [Fibrella aestuarina]CCG99662.1 hypothetical protein FAES_1652 [Fibrella aestuarina BUZ 2]